MGLVVLPRRHELAGVGRRPVRMKETLSVREALKGLGAQG